MCIRLTFNLTQKIHRSSAIKKGHLIHATDLLATDASFVCYQKRRTPHVTRHHSKIDDPHDSNDMATISTRRGAE